MQTKQRSPAHFVVSLLLSALSLTGCATAPMQVTTVARQDLACPNADLAKLSSDRYAASGCGRGAVYVRLCDARGCRWGRLRHGHETAIAAQIAPSPASAPREVIAAPAPEAREVVPAPAPAEREILPAPAPDGGPPSATPPAADPATPAAPGTAPAAPGAAPVPAPVPLSQGQVSEPYEAVVPERPSAQRVAYAPPQPLVEDRPPPPVAGYQWVNGYWFWGTAGWVWLPGYWVSPVVGYSYQPGYWYWSMNYWWYYPGGWCHPGSTTIVYQTAPRSQRIVRVRSFSGGGLGQGTRGSLASSSGASSRGIVRASPGGFRPRSSPLLRYPSSSGSSGRASSASARSGGIGRVVRPGSVASRPSSFANSRAKSARSAPSRSSGGFSSGSGMGGGARYSAPSRSGGGSRAPSVGRATRR